MSGVQCCRPITTGCPGWRAKRAWRSVLAERTAALGAAVAPKFVLIIRATVAAFRSGTSTGMTAMAVRSCCSMAQRRPARSDAESPSAQSVACTIRTDAGGRSLPLTGALVGSSSPASSRAAASAQRLRPVRRQHVAARNARRHRARAPWACHSANRHRRRAPAQPRGWATAKGTCLPS